MKNGLIRIDHAALAQADRITQEFRDTIARLPSISDLDEILDIDKRAQLLEAALKTLIADDPDYRLKANLATETSLRARRHGGEMLTELIRAGRPKNSSLEEEFPRPGLLDLGLRQKQSYNWQLLASIPEARWEEDIERISNSPDGWLTHRHFLNIAEALKFRSDPDVINLPLPDGVDLRLGDFRERLADIPDESVSFVFTDPPYDEESIPLYGAAAEIAARVLKPGGSFMAYCGHYALPEIFDLVQKHLGYWWLCGCRHTQNFTSLPGKQIFVNWKPIIWFIKPPRRKHGFVNDLVDSVKPEKKDHPWEQSESLARYYIDKLTESGETILDPMAGAGTTLIAALKAGRRCIGCEKEVKYFNVCQKNLNSILNA